MGVDRRRYTRCMRRSSALLVLCAAAVIALSAAQAPSSPASSSANAAAIRFNNLGVATMNQQKFEPALKYFEQAVAADANLLTARVNEAIALINLQRYEPAKQLLTDATAADAQNVRAVVQPRPPVEKHGRCGTVARGVRQSRNAQTDRRALRLLRRTDGVAAAAIRSRRRVVHARTLDRSIPRLRRVRPRARVPAHGQRGRRAHASRTVPAPHHGESGSGDEPVLRRSGTVLARRAAHPNRRKTAPAIPVTFAAAPSPFPRIATTAATGGLGAGGCFFDADGDGLVDYLALTPRAATPADAVVLFRAAGGGRFERVAASGFIVSGTPIACTAADYDNDEKPDVAIALTTGVVLFHNDGGHFSDVTAKTGLAASSPGVALGLSFVDFDHDGDVDLIVPRAAAADAAGASDQRRRLTARVGRSCGGTTATPRSPTSLPTAGCRCLARRRHSSQPTSTTIAPSTSPSPVRRQSPSRSIRVRARSPESPHLRRPPSPTLGIVALDVDKDGWMDLAVTHSGQPGVSVWHNAAGKALEPVALPDLGLTRGWGLAAVDYDNDGWMDLVAIGDASAGSKLVVLRNDSGHLVDQIRRGRRIQARTQRRADRGRRRSRRRR